MDMQSILSEASNPESWQDFREHKLRNRQLNTADAEALRDFMDRKAYLPLCALWEQDCFPATLPVKLRINKSGTCKKRIVYSFEGDEGIFLKYIAWQLYRFDDVFCENCYAFRRFLGAKDALARIRRNPHIREQYCLKADISNYFNSINVEMLLEKLAFIRKRDASLYELFTRILREDRVLENGQIDLSANTLRKAKAKIKRKAEALRRWQRKKGLAQEKAAIGLIHAMNRKFYGSGHNEDGFTWSRWFFPCLTVDTGLKELDGYFLQYIRYAATGRHYKGGYRIRYRTVRDWGYRSLVHAYYESRRDDCTTA